MKSYVITKDIKSTINHLAEESQLDIKDLDIDIIETKLYIKNDNTNEKYVSFKKVVGHPERNLTTDITQDNTSLKESYKVLIKRKIGSIWDLTYEINLDEKNQNLTPTLEIEPKFKFKTELVTKQKAFDNLLITINKIKAYYGLITSIFTKNTKKDITNMISKIFKNDLSENFTIRLFDPILPTITEPPEIIKYFGEKESVPTENNLIMEILPQKPGQNGINAYGDIVKTSTDYEKVDITYDETDVRKEIVDGIEKFYTKKGGLINFTDNHIKIENTIKLEQISRLDNQLLTGNMDNTNNVVLDIAQTNMMKDTVGAGVHLISETINITGHIGEMSSLEGKEISVEGSTHKTSTINGKNVKINVNKGMVRCNNATIKILEQGSVISTDVKIDTVVGGIIEGNNIEIDTIKKPVIIKALNYIKINKIECENNKFIITKDLPLTNKRNEILEKKLEKEIDTLQNMQKDKENKEGTEELIKEKEEQIQKIKDELNLIKFHYKEAYISVNGEVPPFNEFTFLFDIYKINYLVEKEKKYDTFKLNEIKDDNNNVIDTVLLPVNKSI